MACKTEGCGNYAGWKKADRGLCSDCLDKEEAAAFMVKAREKLAREEKLTIKALCKKIQREAEVLWNKERYTPSECLFGRFSEYEIRDNYVCRVENRYAMGSRPEKVERLYPLSEFWIQVFAGTEKQRTVGEKG